jgi:hypothetical protein
VSDQPTGYGSAFDVLDKDPNYVYRWCNVDDRAMLRHKRNGYEPVHGDPEIPETSTQPAGTALRKRGPDLVLMRITRTAFEKNIEARRRELRELHATRSSQDAIVEGANTSIHEGLRRVIGGTGVPKRSLIFATKDEPYGS